MTATPEETSRRRAVRSARLALAMVPPWLVFAALTVVALESVAVSLTAWGLSALSLLLALAAAARAVDLANRARAPWSLVWRESVRASRAGRLGYCAVVAVSLLGLMVSPIILLL
ncbi:MAG: hypothetical protein ACFCVG_12045 [Kineosporiaceae bacterium]